MRVRLLGPVDVTVDGAARPVPGLRRKGVLAVLSLQAGQVVSTDRLVEAVWEGRPPATALNTLQRHVSYLREVLGTRDAIVARAPGYVLQIGAEATDVAVAERLIRQAREATDRATSASRLRDALALWRGPALMDVAGLSWVEEQARRLTDLEAEATQALIEVRLALGEHAELVPALQRLTAARPYHESLHGHLMLALYRAGRQADALEAYQRLRRTLRDDLGVDPGPPLRDLEAAILRHDTALRTPPPAIVAAPAPPAVPAQLPLAAHTFTGRDAELDRLDDLLPGADASPTAVVISALSGTAGIGKTALALHWAHRIADRFPDGQLYVNLRGFDPDGSIVDPAAALRSFLDALGVPAARVPPDLSGRAALLRTVLAGRRVLMVLDNARDVAQVRPLLPGSAGCLVLVTSRNRLTALVTTDGAHPLTLDLLTWAQARDLLARRLGADRIAAEPRAVDDIVEHCARLPLALAIAAARAAIQPHLPLAALAAELRAAAGTLDPFHGGDEATDIRAVFSWSYRTLSPGAARLFRLLGLHRGPGITAPAAASLAGVHIGQVRPLLAELTGAHLLAEHTAGRYAFHDLLRAYAAAQGRHEDHDDIRCAAVRRLLDHYLHTGHAAAVLLDPFLIPISPAPARPGVTVERPADHDAALAWFAAEQDTLIAAVAQAADAGLAAHPWELAWTLSTYLLRQGLWHHHAAVHDTALAAARRHGHHHGEAHAEYGLGLGHARSGRFTEAEPHLRRALDLFGQVGDRLGQAFALESLAWICERQDRPADGLHHLNRAFALIRSSEHRVQQTRLLGDLGWFHALLGDHRHAVVYCERALPLCQELGDRNGEAATWDTLGYAYRHLGEYGRAVDCYRRAVTLYRDLNDAYNEATTLANFGDTYQDAGDAASAQRTWQDALRIFTALNHPDAELVRPKLS